ncbi:MULTISPECIES: ABC transporter permease [unclassified Pseudactinotalea]|uniref:ABC transporter permease n=1 Tax=Micrococcales TaxID=85006 RepID=UPI003C7CA6B3
MSAATHFHDPAVAAADPAVGRISWRTPVLMAAVTIAGLLAFGLFTSAGRESRFNLGGGGIPFDPPPLVLPSRLTVLVLVAIALTLTALAYWYTSTRRTVPLAIPISFGVVMLAAFLTWAVAGNARGLTLSFLLATTITATLPFAFGAMAGVLCERSGIINIAIEGQLLMGAFMAAIVASMAGNFYYALIAAPIGGALVGLLLAVFSIRYRVDQIIVGVVLNVLVLGVTTYLLHSVVRDNSSTMNDPPRLTPIRIPLLADIPVVGPALFNHNVIVYAMFATVIGLQFMIFRSRWGLRMRSVGEHPKAADTVGINVNRTRYRNVVFGSAVAGFGGAALVSAGLAFLENITAGRGYIALAAMILGRWKPAGALAAALLFGFADSLNRMLVNISSPVPTELLAMLPYLATIFAVAGLVGRVRPPAAEGKPYPPS